MNETYSDLCLILDTSASFAPNLAVISDGAKETLALCDGDGVRRDYAVVNFSCNTLHTPWTPKTRRAPLNDLLDHVQGEGTMLDVGVLEELAQNRAPFAMLLVTDGMLYERDGKPPSLALLHALVKKGHKFGILYVGDGDIPREYVAATQFADLYCVSDAKTAVAMMKEYATKTLAGRPAHTD